MGKPTFKDGFASGCAFALLSLLIYHTTTGWFKTITVISLFLVYAFGFPIELWRVLKGKSAINPYRDGTLLGIIYFTGMISFISSILYGTSFP